MVNGYTITRQIERELEEAGAGDVAAELKRKQAAQAAKDHPKPEAADIADWYEYLRQRFRRYLDGVSPQSQDEDDGGDSLQTIRDMRYGRDKLPSKLLTKQNYTYRVRSMLSHNEIDRVVALMGRNPLQFTVPASSESGPAKERADKQTRWLNELPAAIERQSTFPLVQRLDDAMVEGGLVGLECYLTGSYDDIDYEYGEGETDSQYKERIRGAKRQRRLPFSFRYVDGSSLLFWEDEDGVAVVLIVEKKRWRNLSAKVRAKLTSDEWNKEASPRPGDPGSPGELFQSGQIEDVQTIRYYDRYWYAYTVNNEIMECEPHGMPGLPVGIGTARVTSSSQYNEMFQGATWGRTRLEQAINDLMTIQVDKRATFMRPKLIATSNQQWAMTLNEGQPFNLDLSGDGVTFIPPGYEIQDAFEKFNQNENDPLIQLLLSFYQVGGMSPVAQGESPGSDVAGYTVNTLQGAANAKYEGLLDNKARLWMWAGDFSRLVVRDVVGEPVEFAAPMDDRKKGGTVWLSLGPDDVDETPCIVTIDPLNDTNRMAIAQHYMNGLAAGLVPPEEVQRKGYGAKDTSEWNAGVARWELRKRLAARAADEALRRIDEASMPPVDTGLVGPDGQPLPPSGGMPGMPGMPPGMGAMPAPPQPPTVGAEMMQAQQSQVPQTNFNAGQRPLNQGVNPMEAAGG